MATIFNLSALTRHWHGEPKYSTALDVWECLIVFHSNDIFSLTLKHWGNTALTHDRYVWLELYWELHDEWVSNSYLTSDWMIMSYLNKQVRMVGYLWSECMSKRVGMGEGSLQVDNTLFQFCFCHPPLVHLPLQRLNDLAQITDLVKQRELSLLLRTLLYSLL